jgi:(1->4)-alpha-D-glucan 1-alpha-D-glucosylmutase
LQLPDGAWTDRLTGRRFEGRICVADLYADLPVALMENTRG